MLSLNLTEKQNATKILLLSIDNIQFTLMLDKIDLIIESM